MTIEKSRPEKMSIRLPDDLRDTIELLAEQHQRSMNAEIVFLCEQALKPKSAAADLSDAIILAETLRRFPGTKLFAEVTVTEKQLVDLQKLSVRRDADGEIIEDDESIASNEPD